MATSLLVVDDEKIKRVTMQAQLMDAGYNVHTAEDGEAALVILEKNNVGVVITDIRMPKMSGMELLKTIKSKYSRVHVIVMTAYGSVETAVEAMKNGAYDYIAKPFSGEEMLLKLERLKLFKQREEENYQLRRQLEQKYQFGNIIGKSKVMRTIFDKIQMVADSNATIIIQGASGTGKELVASALHYNSSRQNRSFIKVSCGIFNREILESELFGHEKGAFTGALRQKPGRFEMANSGTIFLDDVDDIPMATQVKLLRILQEKEFERVGGEKTIRVDARVIAATKRDLKDLVSEGKFREDLYFRLKVIPINLPNLSERKEDIPLLIHYFLKKYDEKRKIAHIAPEVIEFAQKYSWAGNVRELENAIEHAIIFCQGDELKLSHFPEDIVLSHPCKETILWNINKEEGPVKFNEVVHNVEKQLLQWAWEKAGGHQGQIAHLLSMPRTTLRDKLTKHEFLKDKDSKKA